MKHWVLLFCFLCANPAFKAFSQTKKELKQQAKELAYEQTKKLVKSGEFQFTGQWLNTRNGRRVDLTTNYNELIVKQDTVTARLPYFGIVRMAGSTNEGIRFESTDTSFETEFNDKKQRIIIKFKAHEKSENYQINLTISGKGSASMYVSSSHRDPITYNGSISEIRE